MGNSARLTLVVLLIFVLGTALMLDGRKKDRTSETEERVPEIKQTPRPTQTVAQFGPRPEGRAPVVRPRTERAATPQRISVEAQRGPTGELVVDERRHPPILRERQGLPVARRDAKIHIVGENDSFWRIAKQEYGNGRFAYLIRKANPEAARQRYLRVGQKLTIPPHEGAAAPLAVARRPATRTPSAAPRRSGGPQEYVVRPGDKLWNLAQRFLGSGSKYWMIQERNRARIDDPDRLRVGTRLVIPEVR